MNSKTNIAQTQFDLRKPEPEGLVPFSLVSKQFATETLQDPIKVSNRKPRCLWPWLGVRCHRLRHHPFVAEEHRYNTSVKKKLVFGLMMLGTLMVAATSQIVSAKTHFGYMVEVHTCNIDSAGTDSLITMKLDATSSSDIPASLGPWTQDWTYDISSGTKYDDHERNQWDTYYFPESTPVKSIQHLIINSDGKGNKPGWCFDETYITRIEEDNAVHSWRWDGEPGSHQSGWIYGGTYVLSGASDIDTRPIPADLLYTVDYGHPPRTDLPDYGSVAVTYHLDVGQTPPRSCDTQIIGVAAVAMSKSVQGMSNLTQSGTGYPLYQCIYQTTFGSVPFGRTAVKALDAFGSVLACSWADVPRGGIANVDLQPYRNFCY